MSCDASVIVTAPTGDEAAILARRGIERLHELEQRWSRFLVTSEISELNNSAGTRRRTSTDTVRLVETLVQAWHATDGAFDPTLLGALVGLGYVASRDDETSRTSLTARTAPRGRPGEVLVDPVAGIVQLPAGTALDPGGLGKGLAADLVTHELLAQGARGALVEVGGDIRVAGSPPGSTCSTGWAIAVDDSTGREAPEITLLDGGIATSTARLRTWTQAGRLHHHLIDPRTLTSCGTEVVSCTVVAGSAAWAEAFTKVAFVHGAVAALVLYEARSLAASITTDDGALHATSEWNEFCR